MPGLDSAGLAPQVRALLEQLSDEQGLYYCAKGGGRAEGFGAAPDAYAVVYCSAAGVSIALDPADAKVLADQAGFTVTAKTSATHYVKIPAESLNQPATAELVAEALRTAHDRSWAGPRWNRGTTPSGSSGIESTCPIHKLVLARNGTCDYCDGPPPELV